MKVTGIVTEYNPFHTGHIYHINKAREITGCDVLVAVMSGNFVQRGEVAILDKWQRAEIALKHGVDLVIELPFVFVNQSAKQFAEGAINILNMAQVDSIVFGSESNDLATLSEIANMPINVNNLKEHLDAGNSYPKSLGMLWGHYPANDLLGIAYLKALAGLNITPYTIKRTNQYHDLDLNNIHASATAIRHALKENKDISKYSPMNFSQELHFISNYYPYLQTLLLTLDKEYLKELFLFNEGIENHLIKLAKEHFEYDSFIKAATTKRYTTSRIQRTLMSLLVQLSNKEKEALPPLTNFRVLGFNSIGQKYLAKLRDLEIEFASSFAQYQEEYRIIEYRSTVAYTITSNLDYQKYLLQREIEGPIIIK